MFSARFWLKRAALAAALLLGGPTGVRGERAHPWDGLEKRLHDAADRQLEALAQFSEIEREYRDWRRQESARDAPVAQPHPAPVGDFIRFFSTRGNGHYRASISRLARYQPMIEKIFAEENIPRDMIWVGLVESGYNPAARSPKDALGMWQFIPATAERFGLRMGRRDERTDPEKSTRAAARYLKFLYGLFQDWMLALAAYNAEENRVASAIERTGVRDFWELARLGALPSETQNYVPAVLAAALMEKGGWLAKPPPGRQVQAPVSIEAGASGGI